jgi:thiosulfate dehydrogenase
MNSSAAQFLTASVLVVIAGMTASPFSVAQEGRSQAWSIARGGQLYDSWFAVLGHTPLQETHPAYPAAGKQKGGVTWRCKECHGWDYRGAKGAYEAGSHFTGIRGIRDMVGVPPEKIVAIIQDANHRYTNEMIPASEMEKLALFVSLGQIDMDLYVDRASKKVRGDPGHGAPAFQNLCAVCHGFDGKSLNFRDENKPEYVGTIAHENPWEFLHKARFGQPGIPMISLIVLPIQDVVDIAAYAQTLPQE